MKPLKEKISITIDSDILAALKMLCDEDDRSLSQYINLVLKKHIESKGSRTIIKTKKDDGKPANN